MRRRTLCLTCGCLLVIPFFLAACGGTAVEEETQPAAVVKQVKGSEIKRVVLTAEAAKRLGIRLTTVKRAGVGTLTVIPYSAVLYDPNGDTWTYTSPNPLEFVRQDITVDRFEGNKAILAKGPPPGAEIVDVGSTEIWGVEYGGIEED
jgi:hypothetical protein